MNYAIIEFAGKQFLIEPSQDIKVEGQWGTVGEKLNLDKVLLVNSDTLEFGAPYIKTSITAIVKEHSQAKKISVRTYKSKSRYRRHKGSRADLTTLTIQAFGAKEAKATPAAAKATPKPTKTAKPKKETA